VSTFKVDIDRDRCTGHGRCYGFAPEVFEPDDEGFSVPRQALPREQHRAAVVKAVRNCPEKAVIMEEASP
jgi:ferredoxin